MQEEESNTTAAKQKKIGHVLDLAYKYRTETEIVDKKIGLPVFEASISATVGGIVQHALVRSHENIVCWSPMFAPQNGAALATAAQTVDRTVASLAAPPSDLGTNGGPRYKGLWKYPTALAQRTPRYYSNSVSDVALTSLWQLLPKAGSRPLDSTLALHRGWEGDIGLGMSAQELQWVAATFGGVLSNKKWDPTCWFMNVYKYMLAIDAFTRDSGVQTTMWAAGSDVTYTAADAAILCPIVDHINNGPCDLIAATAPQVAVSLGAAPVVNGARAHSGGVEAVRQALYGPLFHTAIVLPAAGGNAVPANCYLGNPALDGSLVFTTESDRAYANHAELQQYVWVRAPPALFDGVNSSHERNVKLAMWILSLLPCMSTVVHSCTTVGAGLGAGNSVENLFYWNGGTVQTLPMRNMVISLPMEAFHDIAVPNNRLIARPTFGGTAVRACRQFGYGAAVTGVGAVVAAFSQILPPAAGTAEVSASAYIASWSRSISLSDWIWFSDWVRNRARSESCWVTAVEYVDSEIGGLRIPMLADGFDAAAANRAAGRYQFNAQEVFGAADNAFSGFSWDMVLDADYVIRSRCSGREVYLPAFHPELASFITMGLLKLETEDVKRALPVDYFSIDSCLHNMLRWNFWVKSVIYDAAYTAVGAPEALLMRSRSCGYARMSAAATAAFDTEMRSPQDQFLMMGERLLTRLYDNAPKCGYLYAVFEELSKQYCSYVGAVVPSESMCIMWAAATTDVIAALAGGGDLVVLDYAISTGPASAPGGVQWAAPAAWPNAGFVAQSRADYGVLFYYNTDNGLGAAADGLAQLRPASLSMKGVYPWLVHKFFGRQIRSYNGFLGGDDLPVPISEKLLSDGPGGTQVRLHPTDKNAEGTSAKSLVDKSTHAFDLERDMIIMDQVAGWTNYRLAMKAIDHVVYALAAAVDERAAIRSICVRSMTLALPAAMAIEFQTPLRNLFSRRYNRYTEDMRNLYFYMSPAQMQLLWVGQQAHVGRRVVIATADLVRPLEAMTIRGRTRIIETFAVDVAAKNPAFVSETDIKTGAANEAAKTRKTEPARAEVHTDTPSNPGDAEITQDETDSADG